MFKKNPLDLKIDEEIHKLLDQMSQEEDRTSTKYTTMVAQLASLRKIRKEDSISKETMATVAANLAGIVIILGHERAHVIASKAFSLVKKIV